MRRFLFTILCVFAAGEWSSADFPKLFNTEVASEANWLSATEAAARMNVPEGFHVSVFASEPDVQNPIAGTWDSRGRLWIAENYTYAERSQRFQLDLRDRVVILDGTHGKKWTRRTVFTDDVQMLTGIEVGRGGVWLMCPPRLIFIPDADGDDVPDHDGEVMLDGFEVAQANYHNFANGLRFGPDGWLYGRCGGSCPGRIGIPGTPDQHRLAMEGGLWRYHPDTRAVEVLTTGTTNPWGHDWNEVGEPFFVNTVNGHLWHAMPGAHFTRPFTLDPNQRTYELIDFHADHWHFDTKGAWHQSRDGVANSFGGGHAHSGTMIYQGGRWPPRYHGRLLTLNFHGRRCNQETLKRQGSGYVAQHNKDFLVAGDPWFRGMEITSGPDGNAFILDWSDTGECHDHNGVHRTSGRIFKVSYGESTEKPFTGDLRDWTNQRLAQTLENPNIWYQRQAAIELASRRARGDDLSGVKSETKKAFDQAKTSAERVQAMLLRWIAQPGRDLKNELSHPDEHVRAWAVRLLADAWPIDDALGSAWKSNSDTRQASNNSALARIAKLAKTDSSLLVQLTLASTLQRLHPRDRSVVARQLVTHGEAAEDHNLPLMIWYGLIETSKLHPEELLAVAKACQLPSTLRLITRALTEQIQSRGELIDELLLDACENQETWYQRSVLTGMAQGLRGWQKAPRPKVWEQVLAIEDETFTPLIRELSVVFGDGRAIDELVAIAKGTGDPDPEMRHAALETLIQSNAAGLQKLCLKLLNDQRINVLAARGLSKFDDPEIGKQLVERYQKFRAPQRPQLMSILVSRKSFAMPMLLAMEQGKIARDQLSPYHVRQINGLGDQELSARVAEVWGKVRDTPEETERRIKQIKTLLSDEFLASARKSRGRQLFIKACQTCHMLYGEGEKVGPNLTGANRSNLDYLIDHIVAPSSVVSKDYRMTLLLLRDGRILSGLVTSETDKVLLLQTATEKLSVAKEEVETRKMTDKSPMPDGLLDQMSHDQIRDLVGYLRHPNQVRLEQAEAESVP